LVYRVKPYGRPPAEYKSLADIPDARAIECIDLVVNPKMGVDVLRECDTLGIANVWIQPGAGDADLLAEAKKLGIHAHEGCVLVELPPNPAAGL
jgi:predicted CoA-binding protein